MIRSAALAFAIAFVAAGSASAEVVARGVQDGYLSLDARGTPSVAFVRGSTLVVATRSVAGRWVQARAASVPAGSTVTAFSIGAAGPVALVENADSRTLLLVRRRSVGWQTMHIAGGLAPQFRLGWPGLALDHAGLPILAYTRWNGLSLNSRLLFARVDPKGRITTKRITQEGFPKSLVPPPAAPVLFGDTVHVVEAYGYRGVLGTIEWYPDKRTWTGFGLDAGIGDYPLGPVFAGLSPGGSLNAAWTDSLISFGSTPVTLAVRRKFASSKFVLDRALVTSLALPPTGPEVAANEWVGSDDLGLTRSGYVWAGTIVHGKSHIELDGWLAALAVAPHGARDLLLGGPDGLRWFRAPRRPVTKVTIEATDQGDGVVIEGRVRATPSGSVTLYRERPGEPRKAIGRAALSGGAFTFTDHPVTRPLLYRAVYTDPASGVPYAALLREPIR
ncbi:MAG: hypothetical protein QOG06_1802 [Gaiellaceae bacterium]|jgi:hypothetical protein|nr:hypothetical protein [Gaiellaceae bacterium]